MVYNNYLKTILALNKMLYKCDHCDYSSKRLFDLRRHENKKFPCYKKLEVVVCKIEVPENVKVEKKIQEKVGVEEKKIKEKFCFEKNKN